MADLTPYATHEQLAAYWRTLTSEEQTRADVLLILASNRLRLLASDDNVDLDAKSVDPDSAFSSVLRWVVMEAVKRAMQSSPNPDMPSVETYSQTAGPYSENYKYTSPTGDLFFRKSELSMLGLSVKQTLDSITPKTANAEFYS